MTNSHAAALGRMSKGVPKTLSKAEIGRRTARLAKARQSRWKKRQSDGWAKIQDTGKESK
jgi:hypothetical protein